MGDKGIFIKFIGEELSSFYSLDDDEFNQIKEDFEKNKFVKSKYLKLNKVVINMANVCHLKFSE